MQKLLIYLSVLFGQLVLGQNDQRLLIIERDGRNQKQILDQTNDRTRVFSELNYSTKLSSNPVLSSLSKQIGIQNEVRLVNTFQSLTFSVGDTIFISCGLIARLDDLSQLAFFLFREEELIRAGKNTVVVENKKAQYNSFESKLMLLSQKPQALELEADKMALERIKVSAFNTQSVDSAISILFTSNLPFGDSLIDRENFGYDSHFIPTSFFELQSSKAKALEKSITLQAYKSRKELFLKRIEAFANETSKNKLTPGDQVEFESLKKDCQLEYIFQSIINGYNESAIYAIRILELQGAESIRLDELKAMAWLHLLRSNIGLDHRINLDNIYHPEVNSSKFIISLRTLNTNGIAAFALRTVYDLKLRGINNKFDQYFEEIVRLSKTSKFVQTEDFATVNFELAERSGIDSLNFHRFLIPDLVSAGVFESSELKSTALTGEVLFIPFVSKFNSKGELLEAKSLELQQKLIQSENLSTNLDFTLKPSDKCFSPEIVGSIASIYSELYSLNSRKNASSICSTLSLGELQKGVRYAAVVHFEGNFKYKLKGVHVLGLLGVTLPFVIPHSIANSYHGNYSVFVYDLEEDKVVYTYNEVYSDPLNLQLMENRVYQSLHHFNTPK